MIAGIALIAAGLFGLIAAFLCKRSENRRTGMSVAMWEALQLPEYVKIAKVYARMHGMPESEWRRFEARAIGDIINRARR